MSVYLPTKKIENVYQEIYIIKCVYILYIYVLYIYIHTHTHKDTHENMVLKDDSATSNYGSRN